MLLDGTRPTLDFFTANVPPGVRTMTGGPAEDEEDCDVDERTVKVVPVFDGGVCVTFIILFSASFKAASAMSRA